MPIPIALGRPVRPAHACRTLHGARGEEGEEATGLGGDGTRVRVRGVAEAAVACAHLPVCVTNKYTRVARRKAFVAIATLVQGWSG